MAIRAHQWGIQPVLAFSLLVLWVVVLLQASASSDRIELLEARLSVLEGER
jgi:hypothetical protein